MFKLISIDYGAGVTVATAHAAMQRASKGGASINGTHANRHQAPSIGPADATGMPDNAQIATVAIVSVRADILGLLNLDVLLFSTFICVFCAVAFDIFIKDYSPFMVLVYL